MLLAGELHSMIARLSGLLGVLELGLQASALFVNAQW